MSAHAIPAEAHATPGPHAPSPHAPGPHEADAQGYRQVLHDLITMGTGLARLLHNQAAAQAAQAMAHPAQQATDEQPAPAASDALISLAAAFDRAARAVRRSILLARSLDTVQPAPIQPAHDPAGHRAATRRRIIREVEDTIQRTAASDGRDSPDTLQAELRERLDAPDLDDDISSRPAADIIAEICRDLGLAARPGTHPWKRRTPADIAQLCALAAAPSTLRPPSAPQPGTRPHIRSGTVQPTPSPQPDPAATPRAHLGPIHPGPIHPSDSPPDDPAGTLAAIPRHPPRVHGRCRPPSPA